MWSVSLNLFFDDMVVVELIRTTIELLVIYGVRFVTIHLLYCFRLEKCDCFSLIASMEWIILIDVHIVCILSFALHC